MYVVRPDESTSGFSSDGAMWSMIEKLIEDYTKVHPKEVRELLKENQAIRGMLDNEYAASKRGIRWGFRLPPALVRLIERRFKNFFVDRNNVRKFMDKFPGFRVAERT